MDELDRLREAAFKTERSACKRIKGMSELEALRQVLTASAGQAGLPALLAARAALRASALARSAGRDAQRSAAKAAHAARHEGPATPWRAWFDGSAHPNPGRCGIGAVLRGPAGELHEVSRAAGFGNSSEAEYLALIAVLELAVQSGAHGLTIYGDSQVVVNDVNGSEDASAPSLRVHRSAAIALMACLRGVAVRWVPRKKNPEADALSQRAVALR
jgi:ribonuclease HI